MGHIHAELMAQYAEDAKQHAKPWELWQHGDGRVWSDCTGHPSWHIDRYFRRKSQTIMLGEHEVPEPCWEPLRSGQEFCAVNPFSGPQWFTWNGSGEDLHALESGFVHLTKEAAEKHYEAFKNLLGKK